MDNSISLNLNQRPQWGATVKSMPLPKNLMSKRKSTPHASSLRSLHQPSKRTSMRKRRLSFSVTLQRQISKLTSSSAVSVSPELEEKESDSTKLAIARKESLLLVTGYLRHEYGSRFDDFVSLNLIDRLHSFHFIAFHAIWSSIHKGSGIILSGDQTMATLSKEESQSIRGRDRIEKGVVAEFTVQCRFGGGMTLGVVKSNAMNDWNESADDVHILDVYGVHSSPQRFYFGNFIRRKELNRSRRWQDFEKPEIRENDETQRVRVVVDYTKDYAVITYWINGMICKPMKQQYTFRLPKILNHECWYMFVDLAEPGSWVKCI